MYMCDCIYNTIYIYIYSKVHGHIQGDEGENGLKPPPRKNDSLTFL